MPRNAICWLLATTTLLAGTAGAAATELVYGAGIPAKSEEITLGVKPYADSLGKLSTMR